MKNYKIKSSRSMSKRFKVTASGIVLRRRACRSHLLEKKSSKRKRNLRKTLSLQKRDVLRIQSKLVYLFD